MPDTPATTAKPTTAEEQIARLARYFRKFKEYEAGLPADTGVWPEHEDLAYVFFLNCYHLKDWIKADPALAVLGDVEAFINSSPELRLCADICNASKHFELTRPRSNENPTVGIPILSSGRRPSYFVTRSRPAREKSIHLNSLNGAWPPGQNSCVLMSEKASASISNCTAR